MKRNRHVASTLLRASVTRTPRTCLPQVRGSYATNVGMSRVGLKDSGRLSSWYLGTVISGAVAGFMYAQPRVFSVQADEPKDVEEEEEDHFVAGEAKEGLREITKEELAKHKTKGDRIWVSYRAGVYDISEFVENHPGGEKILLAAGGALEPFWRLYTVHKSSSSVQRMLEEYRVGNLAPSDRLPESSEEDDAPIAEGQPYGNEPRRWEGFLIRSLRPFNAEPPIQLLADAWRTPNGLFYVRNHMEVPRIDPAEWRLEITGTTPDREVLRLSLEELQKDFAQHTIAVALQCTGNRRAEMSRGSGRVVKGLEWEQGAIGNAEWKGALLREVLRKKAGIESIEQAKAAGILHLQFDGLDGDGRGASFGYGASIPIELALDPQADVLLAWEMNGEPLPRDHGFPVRVIVPGVTGARSVKWLGRITAAAEESESQWQRRDYKAFSPSVDWHNVDWDSAPAIHDTPIQSAICEPRNGTTLSAEDDSITLRGYAWSGGGRDVIRVDVSLDNGATWQVAELTHRPPYRGYNRAWGWTLWEATLSLPPSSGPVHVCCKAVDSSYNAQPEHPAPIWNLRGVLNTSWHRITLHRKD